MKLHTYIDGGSNNVSCGETFFVIQDDKDNTLMRHYRLYPGKKTNNQMEYQALLNLLEYLDAKSYQNDDFTKLTDIKVFSDSQLLVNQMNKEWRVKNEVLKRANRLAHTKISTIQDRANLTVSFIWIRRDENKAGTALGKIQQKRKKEWN